MPSSPNLTFIGCGNMGAAIISGVLTSLPDARIFGYDPDIARARSLVPTATAITLSNDVSALKAWKADLVILAVKPQSFSALNAGIMAHLQSAPTVSIMAGVNLPRLSAAISDVPVIRVMPNLPAMVGQGMSLGCTKNPLTPALRTLVETVFRSVGRFDWVEDEDKFERANPVFGCGPGYVFSIAEHMILAAIAQGVPAELANTLVSQTLLGAATMLSSDGRDAAALKRAVSSPGGTTLAGLSILESENAFPRLIAETLRASYTRAIELSRGDV